MTYDYDIIVVGAGPAGLSAALRARWLRTYKALPASVAVIDPSGLGGLANWKDVLVTGPSFKLDLACILDDLESFPVDFIQAPVAGSSLKGDIKTVFTPDRQVTCRAVIVCTGLKTLCNEREYVGKGLLMTLKDHAFMAAQLEDFCSRNVGARVLLWGTGPAARFATFFDRFNEGRVKFSTFYESGPDGAPGDGRITRIGGLDHVQFVECQSADGKLHRLETDYLLLDFESYMLRTNSTQAFGELACKDGFIMVDHDLRTSVDGVFAAGDATGGPFCAAKAIGEGVKAGFEAYRKTYVDKFGYDPSLYAFYPSFASEVLPERTGFRLPDLLPDLCPKVLGDVQALAAKLGLDEAQAHLLSMMDGSTNLGRLQEEASQETLAGLIAKAVELKSMALHA